MLDAGLFQSAGRIIGWLKTPQIINTFKGLPLFQSAGRIIGWLKMSIQKDGPFLCAVSIRRADYWLVEGLAASFTRFKRFVSIRRADYWLVEVLCCSRQGGPSKVSIRRADYWLVEVGADGRGVSIRRRVSIRRADYWLVEASGAQATLWQE